MEITIIKENINQYTNGDEKIKWRAGKLIKEVLEKFPNLIELDCSRNKIKSLEGLSNCVNLRKLYCRNNKITSLEVLEKFVNLRELDCCHNQLTSLKDLSNCVNLQKLDCSYNQITSLEGLSNCVNLQILYCWNNQIKSLEGLSNCVNLQILYCCDNQITTLNILIHLGNLNDIEYTNNPIEIQNIQIIRILYRIQTNNNSSIYNDKQNVHDTTVQRTVCDSVQNLLNDEKPHFSINMIINSDLNEKTKEALIEYCQDQTIHSFHLITYEELLSYIWNRITKSEHKIELMRIVEEQTTESECKCFTGRFNRTLSVLVGFYDDIKINISDNSRMAAIILNSKEKIIPYNLIEHKKKAKEELIEAGYQEKEIEKWIEAIDE